jgi:hypothetical protein
MNLPGLPEGVEAVRWGITAPGEFGIDSGGNICGHCFIGLVVKPSPGYEFRYDVTIDRYKAVKVFPQPVRVAVQFPANSDGDLAKIRDVAQQLNGEVIAQWPSAR